jgi:hypothetical protein
MSLKKPASVAMRAAVSLEEDNRANAFALVHQIKRLVDFG